MALINCSECNQRISDKATFCPHCGYPMTVTNDNTTSDKCCSYTVILKSAFGNKMNTIKGIKNIFNLGLVESKKLVDNAPSILKRNVPLEEANRIKSELTLYGAEVAVVTYSANDDEKSLLKEYKTDEIHCPHCGSTAITTGQKGFSLFTGFIGSNKTVNRCGKCGYSWEPK